jgi:hypothetical protein
VLLLTDYLVIATLPEPDVKVRRLAVIQMVDLRVGGPRKGPEGSDRGPSTKLGSLDSREWDWGDWADDFPSPLA